MLLVSRQNMAPAEGEDGRRVIGFTSRGDIMLVTSSLTLFCGYNEIGK